VLLVGNPSDDWNWQESLNAYMDRPPNHPGALADAGAVHDRYCATVEVTRAAVLCELRNQESSGPMRGARKRLHLGRSPGITVEYAVPGARRPTVVSSCLSPDYARLLREGRSALQRYDGPAWRGMRTADAPVWITLDQADDSGWAEPGAVDEVGHGVVVRLSARQPTFTFAIGTGLTDADACRRLLGEGKAALADARDLTTAPSTTPARRTA